MLHSSIGKTEAWPAHVDTVTRSGWRQLRWFVCPWINLSIDRINDHMWPETFDRRLDGGHWLAPRRGIQRRLSH